MALDADERIEQANPAAARLLDMDLAALPGVPVHEMNLVPCEGTFAEALAKLRAGASSVEFSTAEQQKLLEVVAKERTRADGSQGALLVLRDITARRWL